MKLFGCGFRPFRPRQRKISLAERNLYSLSPFVPTINFGPPLFRNAFRVRLSNGATNHDRNDLDAERSAIIATCVLSPIPLLPRPKLNTAVEDESFYQLLIFNLDIIYTEHTRRNDSNAISNAFAKSDSISFKKNFENKRLLIPAFKY